MLFSTIPHWTPSRYIQEPADISSGVTDICCLTWEKTNSCFYPLNLIILQISGGIIHLGTEGQTLTDILDLSLMPFIQFISKSRGSPCRPSPEASLVSQPPPALLWSSLPPTSLDSGNSLLAALLAFPLAPLGVLSPHKLIRSGQFPVQNPPVASRLWPTKSCGIQPLPPTTLCLSAH